MMLYYLHTENMSGKYWIIKENKKLLTNFGMDKFPSTKNCTLFVSIINIKNGMY